MLVLKAGMLYVLWVMAALLLLVWMIGMAGSIAVGSAVHLLLLAAVLAVGATLVTRPRSV